MLSFQKYTSERSEFRLTILSQGPMHRKLLCNSQAEEALDFLRSREDFWEQVDVGKDSGGLNQGPGGRKRQTSTSKVLQSTRLTYI